MRFGSFFLLIMGNQVVFPVLSFIVGHKPMAVVRRLQETEPQQACQEAMSQQQSAQIICECIDLFTTNLTSMNCLEPTCTLCNSDSTTCGNEVYSEIFGASGQVDSRAVSFVYTIGLSNSATLILSDCDKNEEAGQDPICESCAVAVGDVDCSSCVVQNCTSGPFKGMPMQSFDCSNVEAGAVFDMCDDQFDVNSGSVFEFLTFEDCPAITSDGDAGSSTLVSSSQIPTDTPNSMPSAAPSDMSLVDGNNDTTVDSESASIIPSDMPSLMPTSAPSSLMTPDMETNVPDSPGDFQWTTTAPSPSGLSSAASYTSTGILVLSAVLLLASMMGVVVFL